MAAALDRARSVLVEDRILRLDSAEVIQLEKAPDGAPAVVPQLARLLNGVLTPESVQN